MATLLELAFPNKYVFWDKRLLGGDDTDNKLQEQVRRCQVFVFFASNSSMSEHSYCKREVAWARQYDKQIVPYIVYANPEEVVSYLGNNNIFCVIGGGIESFAKLCGSIFQGFTAATYSEPHRKQMYLLYSILDKLEDDDYYQEAAEAYVSGYELNYDWSLSLDQSMSEKRCKEILDILHMMARLQADWEKLSDKDKEEVERKTHNLADFTITQVGFQSHGAEAKEWGYLRHLRRHGRFADLSLVYYGDGGHTFLMLPTYRKMLEVFNNMREEHNGLDFFVRNLTPLEFIEIINVQFP